MTREKILGIPSYPHECGSMIEVHTRQDALKAMSEFAQQKVAAATHPLQEKIDGLREALTIIVDVTGHTAGEVYMMQDIAKQALETYK